MTSLDQSLLYGILDLGYVEPDDLADMTSKMIEGGIDILQFRAKNFALPLILKMAGTVHQLTREAGIPLIINDYPSLVSDVPAEGAHVGQEDPPVGQARSLAGRGSLIGKSTHSLAQARAAFSEKPDYIGFGPIYATDTKPDYAPIGTGEIARVEAQAAIPVFCIGGIKLENLEQVLDAGAKRVVIVSGILQAPDVAGYAAAVKKKLVENFASQDA